MSRVSAIASKVDDIIADLQLAESKKQELHQAFLTLKSDASSVASFSLQWSDLDSHFSSLHSSLQNRLQTLQSQLEQIRQSEPNPNALVNILSNKQPNSSCRQVSDALRSSPCPATLVLDSILLLLKNGEGDFRESVVRDCELLLEQLVHLVRVPPEVDGEVREKARRLAVEWKAKMRAKSVGEVMGFLEILWMYGLVGEFDRDDVFELFEIVAPLNRAPELCRLLGFQEKMPELIKNLIKKKKRIQAIKFIYEFELVEFFPPVHLLKDHLRFSKKVVKKIRRKGKHSLEAQKGAASKELAILRVVERCITKYKLEGKFPFETLQKNIGQLKKLQGESKATPAATDSVPSPASASASKPQPQPQQQTGKKPSAAALETQPNQQRFHEHQHTTEPAGVPNGQFVATSSVQPIQSPTLQHPASLTGQSVPCLTPPPGYYGLAGPITITTRMSLSSRHYGSTSFNPLSQYKFPPDQICVTANQSNGQFGFTSTHFGVAPNLFNFGGPNWPLPYYSSNAGMQLGYGPVNYGGGYGLPPNQHPS